MGAGNESWCKMHKSTQEPAQLDPPTHRCPPCAEENLANWGQQLSTDPFPWENISSSPSLNQASGVGNAVPSGWSTLFAAFCQKCSDLFFSLDFLIFLTSCTGVCPGEAQEQKLESCCERYF